MQARGLTPIVAYTERARVSDLTTKALEQRWNTQQTTGVYRSETHALDTTVDQILMGMQDMVTGQMRGLGAHESVHQVGAE